MAEYVGPMASFTDEGRVHVISEQELQTLFNGDRYCWGYIRLVEERVNKKMYLANRISRR